MGATPFTFVRTDDIGKVRLLIPDAKEAEALFNDDDITAFLELSSGTGNAKIFRAVALAKLTIADDTARVESYRKTQALEVDGSKTMKLLQDSAKSFEARATALETAPVVIPVEDEDDLIAFVSPRRGCY